MEFTNPVDYKKKREKLKSLLEKHSSDLEEKHRSVHHDWAKEFRDRDYEIRCVLTTMESIEKDA